MVSNYVEFLTWDDVLKHARAGHQLWYRAPMDRFPRNIRVVKVFKNGGIRIDPLSNDCDNFTADNGHLTRFLKRS